MSKIKIALACQGGGSHTLHVGVTVAPVDQFPTTFAAAAPEDDR